MAVNETILRIKAMTQRERDKQAEPFVPTSYNLPDGDWPPLANPLPPISKRVSWVMIAVIGALVLLGVALIVAAVNW